MIDDAAARVPGWLVTTAHRHVAGVVAVAGAEVAMTTRTDVLWFLEEATMHLKSAEEALVAGDDPMCSGYLCAAWGLWSAVAMLIRNGVPLDGDAQQEFDYIKLKFAQFANHMPALAERAERK